MSAAKSDPFPVSARRVGHTALAMVAAFALSDGVLAQWSGNPKKNNFAAEPCQPPPGNVAGILALDPVLVPCNDGCFYAWVDPQGQVRIQVIDPCGKRAFASAFVVPGTSGSGGGIVPIHFTQLAGCTYANADGAKNQLFLAYTVWNSTLARDEMFGQCFDFTTPLGVPTLIPGSAVSLCLSTTLHGILTPCADTSFDTSNPDAVVGAVWGCRDYDFVSGASTMTIGNVTGPFALPTQCGVGVDAFPLPAGALPPRLSVLSDDAGGVYGAWRGYDPSGPTYYYMGTRRTATCGLVLGWPTAQLPTTRTTDDWVIARDLAGGVFVSFREDPGFGVTEELFAAHVDGAGVWSNALTVASVPTGQLIGALAMSIMPPDTVAPFPQRAALAFRADTDIDLLELRWSTPLITAGWTANLSPISGTANARGCATLADKGVAVGWVGDFAAGGWSKLYGQEVDLSGNKLWNSGDRLEVSVNTSLENKAVPMVVSKYSRPEVIYGWIDTRTVANSPGATIPGGYVQSVADDFLPIPAPIGLKRKDGKLGSSANCFAPNGHFGIHDVVFSTGNPTDSDSGAELFKLDPTDGTYQLVADIDPGTPSSLPSLPVGRGNRRVFAATTLADGREPWVTDGTAAGTMQLADCAPGPGSSSPTIVWFEDAWTLATSSPATGRELWRTDGTPGGTAMVLDLNPGPASGVASIDPTDPPVLDGYLYFSGNDGVRGIELWRTDGTAAGTTIVADLSPGSASSGPNSMVVLGNRIVFTALVSGVGREPYVFDPATNTVTLLGDLAPGAVSSSPGGLKVAAGATWFSADDGSGAGRELWRTDGTPAGTQMVRDIHPTDSSSPRDFVDAGGFVLFRADDGVHGAELWRSDGTAAGTMLVADVEPGPSGSNLAALTPIGGGRFLFTATSAGVGREPWITDGTAAGTMLVADLNPGAAGSNPNRYDVVAGSVYCDALIGGESSTVLLTLDAPAVYGDGCAGTGGRVPRIGAPGGSPRLGQTFTVTLQDAPPSSLAFLVFNVRGTTLSTGSCTVYVDLPVLDSFAVFTDGSGSANVSLAVPNNPLLVGLDIYWQWVVLDPAGPLLGAFSLSDAMRSTIE